MTTEKFPIAVPKSDDDAPEPAFQDWSRFISFQPRLYFRPQSIEELKSFLLGIHQGIFPHSTPRVLGGLHSCSDICVSDTIIDVSDLPRTIEYNSNRSIVTVTANWHLHEFLAAISASGKSITATGGTDHQTLAGVISTNTAPASPHHLIYELVEWIEYLIISKDGKSVVEKRVLKSEKAFRAVVASLGAIGILTRIQLRVVDELYFDTIQKCIRLEKVLTDLKKTSEEYDFWRIDWIPDTEIGLFWGARQVPAADPDGDYRDDESENILVAIFNVMDKIGSAGPLLDSAMRLVYAGLTLTYNEVKASGPMRHMLPVDRRAPLHVAMAEWSFDPADLDRLMKNCREYYQKNGWPNLPIEIELTKTDDYFMSPWNWPGLAYIVKFNFMYLTDICSTDPERNAIVTHLHGLWDHLLLAGIPFKAHWGKINFMDYNFVSQHFALADFEPYLQPMFINGYLAERLFPGNTTK